MSFRTDTPVIATSMESCRLDAPGPVTVVHAVPGDWLPATQTWLHRQVASLPPAIASHVVCRGVRHLDRFPVANLHAGRDEPRAARMIDAALRRVRLRRGHGHLARALARTGASVLHSHFGPEAWRNRDAARRAGVRHVVSFYGYDVTGLPRSHPRWRDRYRVLFAHVDLVLCEGEHMAACLRNLGAPPHRVQVHRLGVELDSIPFAPCSWDGTTPLHVLIAAAFREKKGIPLALGALARLRNDVDLRITLVGEAGAHAAGIAEQRRIDAVVAEHDLAPILTRHPFLAPDALRALAAAHHLYLAPSRTAADGDTEGGAPVALIEMAAAGLAIVSTDHCDIPGVVRDGDTGWLAHEDDPNDLVQTLRRAVAARAEWPAVRARAREWLEARFDARRQGVALAGRYRALVAPGARSRGRGHDAPTAGRIGGATRHDARRPAA